MIFFDGQARRSMVYAKPLRDVGDLFRKTHLDSDDERDNTFLKDWTTVKVFSLQPMSHAMDTFILVVPIL